MFRIARTTIKKGPEAFRLAFGYTSMVQPLDEGSKALSVMDANEFSKFTKDITSSMSLEPNFARTIEQIGIEIFKKCGGDIKDIIEEHQNEIFSGYEKIMFEVIENQPANVNNNESSINLASIPSYLATKLRECLKKICHTLVNISQKMIRVIYGEKEDLPILDPKKQTALWAVFLISSFVVCHVITTKFRHAFSAMFPTVIKEEKQLMYK